MTHNAAKTQQYVNDAWNRFLPFRNPVDRNYRAFAFLRGKRRRGDEPLLRILGIIVPDDPMAPFDVDLADAEHYMYARFLASSTGDPSIKALVTGYEVKKYVDTLVGREQEMRTNPKFPVLPPSVDAVKWGLKGVEDGMREFRDTHGGQSGKFGSAIRENAEFIKGNYPRYGLAAGAASY